MHLRGGESRPHAGAHRRRARQRPVDRQRRVRFLGDLARHHRTHRGSARTAELDLWLRRDGRRGQHHHAQAARAAASFSATVEGGSYGTHVERLSGGFAKGDFSLLMSGEHVATSGFSNVGNRDHDEADGFEKWNGSISGRYAPADGPSFDFGVTGTTGKTDYDGSPGWGADPANARNIADKTLVTGYGRLSFGSPDGHVKQSLTGFATAARRHNYEPGPPARPTISPRTRWAANTAPPLGQGPSARCLPVQGWSRSRQATRQRRRGRETFDDTATRYALFAGDQISPIDHLFLTFSGRYDGQPGADGFLTGRFTAAYEISGNRNQTARQPRHRRQTADLFPAGVQSRIGVTTPLQSEKSIGGDIGIDQTLFDGRLTLSATAFLSRFTNLLNFDFERRPLRRLCQCRPRHHERRRIGRDRRPHPVAPDAVGHLHLHRRPRRHDRASARPPARAQRLGDAVLDRTQRAGDLAHRHLRRRPLLAARARPRRCPPTPASTSRRPIR